MKKNILVTTGTTEFPSLIRILDNKTSGSFSVIIQSPKEAYESRRHRHFDFSDEFSSHLQNADLVITHAGAGTVFNLLENYHGKFAVIPNLERQDKHQIELWNYLRSNNYCYTLMLEDLKTYTLAYIYDSVSSFVPEPYEKCHFRFTESLFRIVRG